MNKTNTKAQITLFVIIGLFLLITIGIVIYIQTTAMTATPNLEQLDVSTEAKPLQEFVTTCIEQVGKQGLKKLGKQGGYISLQGLRISPLPYDSDAVIHEPYIVPYWLYIDDCPSSSSGCSASKQPALCPLDKECLLDGASGEINIEEELSLYINQNLDSCLNDFTSFTDRFDIQKGEIQAQTFTQESGVLLRVDMPLELTSTSTEFSESIPYFIGSLDLKLSTAYKLAEIIAQNQANYTFLETTVLDLIHIYSGLDSDLLPPFAQTSLSGKKVFWITPVIKETLRYDVLPYLNFMQIMNAQNYDPIILDEVSEYTNYGTGIYRHMEIKLDEELYPLNANFVYPYSDFYLNINDETILKPESVDDWAMKLIGIFFEKYEHKYDIAFPVLVKLEDPEAFDGEGWEFWFALEGNIQNNRPVIPGSNPVSFQSGGASINLDDERHKPNITHTVIVKDKLEGFQLNKVHITYTCGKEFYLGDTHYNADLERSEWTGKMPFCQFGGVINAKKDGYQGNGIQFNNHDQTNPEEITIELWPLEEKEVFVQKRTTENIENIDNFGVGAIRIYKEEATNLSINDTLYINIQKYKDSPHEETIPMVGFLLYKSDEFNQQEILDDQKEQLEDAYTRGDLSEEDWQILLDNLEEAGNTQTPEDQEHVLEFVPGKYAVEATLLHADLTIPESSEPICPHVCCGVWPCGDEEEIIYPEQHFSQFPSGGLNINITLTENDIYQSKDILFYLFEQVIPESWDQLTERASLEELHDDYRYLLTPIFIE